MNLSIRCLESILDYNLTDFEAKSVKIMYLYIESVQRIFPDFHIRYPKGDPRKTYLFKVCYKLVRENLGTVVDADYPLYVIAQLDIIRRNTERFGSDAHISPICLVGEKAQKRWYVWKKIYDKKLNRRQETAKDAGVDAHSYEKVITTLKQDKQFLSDRLVVLSKETLAQAVEGRAMLRWIATKQVSPYYGIMSSILNNWLKEHTLTLDSVFNLDFNFYRPGITTEVQEFFNAFFSYEA